MKLRACPVSLASNIYIYIVFYGLCTGHARMDLNSSLLPTYWYPWIDATRLTLTLLPPFRTRWSHALSQVLG